MNVYEVAEKLMPTIGDICSKHIVEEFIEHCLWAILEYTTLERFIEEIGYHISELSGENPMRDSVFKTIMVFTMSLYIQHQERLPELGENPDHQD